MRGPPLEPIAAEAVPPAGGALLSPRLPPRRQPDAPVSPRGDAEPTPLSPRAPSRAPSAMRRPMPDASASDVAGTPLSPRTLPRRPPPALDAPAAAAVPMRTPARVGGAAAVRAPPPVAQAPVVEQAPIAAMPLSPRTPMRMPARLANGPARPARTPIASSPPVPADLTPPRVGSMKAPPIPQSDPTPPPIPASDGSLRRGAVQAGGQYGLTSMAKPVHTPSNEYVAVAPLADDRPLPLVQQESSYGQVPPQPQSNYGLTPKKPSAPGALQTPAGFTPVLSAVPLPRKVAMNAISRGSGGSGGSGTPPPGEYVLQPIAARSESEYSLGDDDASPPSTPPPPSQNEYVQVDPLPRESHRNEYAKVEPLGPPSEYVKVDFSDKNSNSSQDVVPPAQPESPMAPAVPTLSASATPPAGSLGSPNGIVSSSSSAPMLAKGAFYGTVGISSVSHASLISNTGLMKDARVPMTLTARQSRYAPFLQILSGSSLLLINALCVAAGGADEEPLLTAICCGLDAHGMLRDAVTSGIAAEVAGSADATTLFRANNGTTKLVGAFTKLVGQQYLISLIKPYIAELSTSKDTCEVDATKLNKEDYEADFVEADVVADNVEQLKHWTTRLLQKLTASLAECPPALKWLSAALRVGVTHRFPSSGTVSVAGFYFLRYVCPALVAPVARGVTTQKPLPRVVNALKYISKMVQAMANGVVFKKEASMLPLNDYVREHSAQVNEICNALAGDTSPTMPPLASVGDAESIHLRYVYLFMVQNRDKVEKSLVSYKQDEVLGMIPDVIDAIGMSQNAQLTPLKEKLQVDEVLSRKESVADATGADAGAAGGASKARGRKLERRTGRGALAMMSGAVKCEVCGERPFESRVTRADGKAVLACNACEASGAAVAMN
jgi:hypothetical protein